MDAASDYVPVTRYALAVAVLFPLMALAAEPDVPGSRDPLGVARYAHSWIVLYSNDDNFLTREVVISRLDKTRPDARVEHEIRARTTFSIEAQIPEQALVEAFLVDATEKLLWHDLIGVEIRDVDDRGDTVNSCLVTHDEFPICVRL